MRDGQGASEIYTLLSAVYSHGLACAQEYNDSTFSQVLCTVYREYHDSAFNPDNGDAIMRLACNHPLMQVLFSFAAFTFFTGADYQAALHATQQSKAARKVDEAAPEDSANISGSTCSLDDIYEELEREESSGAVAEGYRRILVASSGIIEMQI